LNKLKGPPPGFEDVPVGGKKNDDQYGAYGAYGDYGTEAADPTGLPAGMMIPGSFTEEGEDPFMLGLHDGSLSQRLAYDMNLRVNRLRSNSVRSIEQIMLDQVINYQDGQGPCTTVECLLTAATETARIFILEQNLHQPAGGNHHYGNEGGHNMPGKYG